MDILFSAYAAQSPHSTTGCIRQIEGTIPRLSANAGRLDDALLRLDVAYLYESPRPISFVTLIRDFWAGVKKSTYAFRSAVIQALYESGLLVRAGRHPVRCQVAMHGRCQRQEQQNELRVHRAGGKARSRILAKPGRGPPR
ncbi:hypothetical protein ACCO45_009820 [Purpureocillium lilacinum]|uniref:Uncharacterized protein n=1 Tax=Purpureocillium lilacinum TaxID=33203 RepID=A0ACC4DKX8_PURLI